MTGTKGGLAVKIFGPDLDVLEQKGEEMKAVMAKIPGINDLKLQRDIGQPNLDITVDRAGARVLESTWRTCRMPSRQPSAAMPSARCCREKRYTTDRALPGAISQYQGSHSEYPPAFSHRESACLSAQLTKVEIQRRRLRHLPREEYPLRRSPLQGARPRSGHHRSGGHRPDRQESEAAARLLHSVVGRIREREAGRARLAVIVPLTILVIFIILYTMFRSYKWALLILVNVAMARIGGLLALLVTDTYFSVSSGVGMLALFGVSVQTGVIMLEYINQLRARGYTVVDAAVEGAVLRLRPIMMTMLVATFGLLPAAMSHDIGSDSQRPFAIVIVGGLVGALAISIILLPTLYVWIAQGR